MRALLHFTTTFLPNLPPILQRPVPLPKFRHLTRRYQSRTTTRARLSTSTPAHRPKISIIGGGFGGLFTTIRLASLPWTRLTRPEITLIDRNEQFVFSPMLYELVVGEVEQWEIAPLYSELLKDTGVKFLQMGVEEIKVSGDGGDGGVVKGVGVGGDEIVLGWDKAVISLGGEEVGWKGEGKNKALGFKSVEDARVLKERLRSLLDTVGKERLVKIVVVGGGYSGVELAATIAGGLTGKVEVALVERGDRVLKSGTGWNRRVGERAMEDYGVLVQYRTELKEINDGGVVLQSREDSKPFSQQADVVVWTAGVKPNRILDTIDAERDDSGRLLVDERLQMVGKDGMFALGDCVTVQGSEGQYGGTAQVAMQQAEYAAWNMWAGITGKQMLDYRYSHLGEMMVLGSSSATLSTPFGINLDGPLAHAIRRTAYLMRMPTDNHRAKVAASWASTPVINTLTSIFGSSTRARPSEL